MKKWKFVLPLLLVFIYVFIVSGYRFTTLSAAEAHSFLPKDAELIEQFGTDSTKIYLFKSDEEEVYHTVLSEKSGVFFRSRASTYIPYSTDEIQTVGAMSVINENDAATLLSVVSHDEEVSYIEAGVEHNVERKEIQYGERISFLFPFSEQIDFLYPTAFNKDGKKLYYYGYPKNTNVTNSTDLKWHKIDGQQ